MASERMAPFGEKRRANQGPRARFQQLELAHVPDKGCFGAMEFR